MSNFDVENFPTAKECNVNGLSNKIFETDLEMVFYSIVAAVSIGQSETEVGVTFPSEVVSFLKEKGFNVEVVNTREAALYEMKRKKKLLKISWE